VKELSRSAAVTSPAPCRVTTKCNTLLRITEAAWGEFSERGFYAARIELIAERAQVTRQLIYRYFKSKNELYLAAVDMEIDRYMEPLRAIDYVNNSPLDILRQYVTALFNVEFDMRRLSKAGLASDVGATRAIGFDSRIKERCRHITNEVVGNIAKVMERGKQAGVIQHRANAEVFHNFSVMTITGCTCMAPFLMSCLEGEHYPNQEMIEMMFWRDYTVDVMVRSVSPPG
jgi:AcrR family transcriptional regulator